MTNIFRHQEDAPELDAALRASKDNRLNFVIDNRDFIITIDSGFVLVKNKRTDNLDYIGQAPEVLEKLHRWAVKTSLKSLQLHQTIDNPGISPEFQQACINSERASLYFLQFEDALRTSLKYDTGHGRIYCTPAPSSAVPSDAQDAPKPGA